MKKIFTFEVLYKEGPWAPEQLPVEDVLESVLSEFFEDVVILGSSSLIKDPDTEIYFVRVWTDSAANHTLEKVETALLLSERFQYSLCIAAQECAISENPYG